MLIYIYLHVLVKSPCTHPYSDMFEFLEYICDILAYPHFMGMRLMTYILVNEINMQTAMMKIASCEITD